MVRVAQHFGEKAERTVVGCHELINSMVRLPALNRLLAVDCSRWKLIRPIHPVDPGINVMFVTRTYLQDACYPVVVGLFSWLERVLVGNRLLSLDSRFVCDVYEALTEVFDLVHCVLSVTFKQIPEWPGTATYGRSCYIASYLTTSSVGLPCSAHPLSHTS